MGVVYRAEHVQISKVMAIKLLHREVEDNPENVARFHREAEAASRLDHPNTVQVFDFGRTDAGSLYLTMEYVDGRDLGKIISREGPIPFGRVAYLCAQVAGSIADAHAAGVIHRDPDVMQKLEAFRDRHIDGHAPLLSGHDLNAYVAAGIRTEHEATHAAEAVEKLQRGLRVLIRKDDESAIPVYVLGLAYVRIESAPAVALGGEDHRRLAQYLLALIAIVPPLLLILIVLGSIFAGVATPTESSALGGVGAILLSMLYRKFTWRMIYQSALETVKVTAMVFAILLGATAFSMAFSRTMSSHFRALTISHIGCGLALIRARASGSASRFSTTSPQPSPRT